MVREIANDRIARLLGMAEEKAIEGTDQSKALEKRYVSLARKILLHYKVKLPRETSIRICKACMNMMVPGKNCRVRKASSGFLVYICECGSSNKLFLRKTKHAAGKPAR